MIKMLTSGLFSSLSGDWQTPKEIYALLDQEFHFDFDPCPPNPTFDGLDCQWGKRNFLNPPYGRLITRWIQKAEVERIHGNLTVLLLPSRTDTRWFHDFCIQNEIRFIKGRLHFNLNGHTGPAPFPSMICIFRPKGAS